MDTDRIEEEARLLHDPDEDTNRSQQKGAGRWTLSLLVLAGLGYFIYYAWGHWVKPAAADATPAQSAAAGGGGRRRRPRRRPWRRGPTGSGSRHHSCSKGGHARLFAWTRDGRSQQHRRRPEPRGRPTPACRIS